MEDSILIVIGFGIFVGWSLNSMYRQYKDDIMFKQIMVKIDEEEAEQKVKALFPMCYIEEDNDTYILYNKDSHAYMCQGDSYDELAQKVYTELKIDVALAKHMNKSMWFIAGDTKDLIEF
jgi:hypothetical protein